VLDWLLFGSYKNSMNRELIRQQLTGQQRKSRSLKYRLDQVRFMV
jgi:hypothetical protein